MNYWLHRISYQTDVSYPLLDKNLLTIGFSDFASHDFIDKVLDGETWEERWYKLEAEFDNTWGSRPRIRHNLWRFVEGFKKGDWIIVPSWGVFSIYELTSDMPQPIGNIPNKDLADSNGNILKVHNGLLHRNEQTIDLGFFWEVKAIEKNISRYEFADSALTSRMKIRTTNALITELKDSIEKALTFFRQKKPINIHAQIIDNTVPEVLNTIISELNSDKFELLVKWYFERVGATEVYIPPKNERGKEGDADVIAIFEPIKLIIYTQVKFHRGETSSWAIQQVVDYKNKQEEVIENEMTDDEYSRISWVISSADGYSEQSFRQAKTEKVQLIDGRKFSQMLIEAGILTLDKVL